MRYLHKELEALEKKSTEYYQQMMDATTEKEHETSRTAYHAVLVKISRINRQLTTTSYQRQKAEEGLEEMSVPKTFFNNPSNFK